MNHWGDAAARQGYSVGFQTRRPWVRSAGGADRVKDHCSTPPSQLLCRLVYAHFPTEETDNVSFRFHQSLASGSERQVKTWMLPEDEDGFFGVLI